MSDVQILLDPAVEAAKRVIVQLKEIDDNAKAKELIPKGFNDDVVTMAIVILRIAGYQITDHTGEGIANTTPVKSG